MNTTPNNQRGFTLLFAVLVSTLVLAVGASVINIAIKQIQFSGYGRESQISYYAADSGLECALYWDFQGLDILGEHPFATSTQSVAPTPTESIKCGEGSIVYADTAGGFEGGTEPLEGFEGLVDGDDYLWNRDLLSSQNAVTTFRMVMEDMSTPPRFLCADVRVEKTYDTVDDRIATMIDARGYNSCDSANQFRYERGLRVRY